ncbi:HNH endonuclease [Halorientalis regularis]|uniref:HNH endonuclease n=1 Tax=Halorientalis regularis TaxID=660518 RepID=A0A1G7TYC3_9EURY|nr:HNH endonuclease [Halorientalis regularis]SDG40312.1 HNH endonuclease [Halorientalis regularis]
MGHGYPPDWKQRRQAVYKRDNFQCQNCGRRGGPRGNSELHAHHVVPKSKGGTHNLSNLITVCKPCHEQIHGRPIPTGGSKNNSRRSNSYSSENESQHGSKGYERVSDPVDPTSDTDTKPYWEKKKENRDLSDATDPFDTSDLPSFNTNNSKVSDPINPISSVDSDPYWVRKKEEREQDQSNSESASLNLDWSINPDEYQEAIEGIRNEGNLSTSKSSNGGGHSVYKTIALLICLFLTVYFISVQTYRPLLLLIPAILWAVKEK